MSTEEILKAEIGYTAMQAKILNETVGLLNSKAYVPSISKYFPQSVSEIEVQEFNTACKIPSRLISSEDDIALWILESEELNRSKTAIYLTNSSDTAARVVLEKIAIKICSLEIAGGFVDGLKFFLPVVGCFDINVGTSTDIAAELSSNELNTLKYVLKIYCQAHLYYSKNPLFDIPVGMENLSILIDLALSVLEVCKILHLKKKSQTIAMSDFFTVVRTLLRRGSNLSLSIKKMTDLFVSSSTGRGLTALKLPLGLPSYVFSEVKKEGYVSMGFQLDTPFKLYYARLCYNALYLFDPSVEVSLSSFHSHTTSTHNCPYKLVCCIPLETVHIQLMDRTEQFVNISGIAGDESSVDCDSLLEFMSINEYSIPLIEYNHKEHYINHSGGNSTSATAAATQEWLGPKTITNHASIFVNVDAFEVSTDNHPVPEFIPESKSSKLNSWMDALENCCWESRVTKNKNAFHHK